MKKSGCQDSAVDLGCGFSFRPLLWVLEGGGKLYIWLVSWTLVDSGSEVILTLLVGTTSLARTHWSSILKKRQRYKICWGLEKMYWIKSGFISRCYVPCWVSAEHKDYKKALCSFLFLEYGAFEGSERYQIDHKWVIILDWFGIIQNFKKNPFHKRETERVLLFASTVFMNSKSPSFEKILLLTYIVQNSDIFK